MEQVRTCVGCRQRASRNQLLRVVSDANRLKPDERAVFAGRGAWIHANEDCLRLAIERRAFGRALRLNQQADPTELIAFIEKVETMLAK
jgi:predicted RNA-binding protein YlxR (DUF448 family)